MKSSFCLTLSTKSCWMGSEAFCATNAEAPRCLRTQERRSGEVSRRTVDDEDNMTLTENDSGQNNDDTRQGNWSE